MTRRWRAPALAVLLLLAAPTVVPALPAAAAVPTAGQPAPSAPATADAVEPAEARREAAEILRQRRYQPRRQVPGRGVLSAIGRGAARVLRPFGRAAAWVVRPIATAVTAVWSTVAGRLLLVLMAVVFGFVAVFLLARRRRATALDRSRSAGLFDVDDDPDQLEAAAQRAAAAGDHATAVRLRFRAGLVRLHRQGVGIRPSMTTREIGRAVSSRRFDEIGRTFDRVAYGGDTAAADDVAAAETGWRQVLADVGGRR